MAPRPTLLRQLIAPAVSRGRSFARDERGVTAIEFGILALPFFTIIFAIIETTMVFFAGQVLDSAVEDASRMIKTGRAQAAGYNMTNFRSLMCGYTFGLFGTSARTSRSRCRRSRASRRRQRATACRPATMSGQKPAPGTVAQDFNAGAGRDVIQVFALLPLAAAGEPALLQPQEPTRQLSPHCATRVFRNEPFS